jgi:hypothetical protein
VMCSLKDEATVQANCEQKHGVHTAQWLAY